jgi:hypothetical protein
MAEQAALGRKQILSAIIHRTVWCISRPMATWHVSRSQRSAGAPESPVPPEAESEQLVIRDSCTVQRLVCTGHKAIRAFQMELQRLLGPMGL